MSPTDRSDELRAVRKAVRDVAERGGTAKDANDAAQALIGEVIVAEFDMCPVDGCPHSMRIHTDEGRCRVISCSGSFTPCMEREIGRNRPPYRGPGQRGSEAGCYR